MRRVQFISVSLDGFRPGDGQSLARPFGHADERLNDPTSRVPA